MEQTNNNDRFMNPYNFIAFPKQKAKAYDDKDRHTGVIKYSITTKTPLFIPNSSSDSAFQIECQDHKSYDFFSYTELEKGENYKDIYHEPVIPGSEIRGVVRSVYETLTDSCMGILNADIRPVKRVPERFKPALLYKLNKTDIALIKANAYSPEKSFDDNRLGEYCNGKELFFTIGEKKKNYKGNAIINKCGMSEKELGDPSKIKKGYLIRWGKDVGKKKYHIFEKSGTEITIRKKTEIQQIVEDVINSYLEQPALDSSKEAYEAYRDAFIKFINEDDEKKPKYFPINYIFLSSQKDENNTKLYLSPSTLGKIVSYNNIGKLAGNMLPCSRKAEMCPACDLFGYVSSDEKHSSGIRFSDMYIAENGKENDNKGYYCNIVTLPALAAPKLGNVDFYLKKPENAKFWTYDYYVDSEWKKYLDDGELRGRKFYWHHQTESVQLAAILSGKQTPTNLNKTVRPVKDGITFSGELYFENISEKQLKQLCWILNMGKKNLGLKLGSAKPFGFGTVITKVDSVKERIVGVEDDSLFYELVDHSEKFKELKYDEVDFSGTVKNEFNKIARLELDSIRKDQEITYPKTKPSGDKGYEWFVSNRKGGYIHNDLDSIRHGEGLLYVENSKSYKEGKKDKNQNSQSKKGSSNNKKGSSNNKKGSSNNYNGKNDNKRNH